MTMGVFLTAFCFTPRLSRTDLIPAPMASSIAVGIRPAVNLAPGSRAPVVLSVASHSDIFDDCARPSRPKEEAQDEAGKVAYIMLNGTCETIAPTAKWTKYSHLTPRLDGGL